MADKPESVQQPKAPEPIRPRPTDVVIDQWFVEHINGSPVSRDTEVYNHVLRAVDRLKALIGGKE